MDIDFLRDFTVIAQQENMTLAADILNISPSALSNNLHKLEAELGCQLFTRTSKGIRLNDSGRYFLEWVRKNGDFQEKTLKKLEDSTKIRGTLKIGAAVETDTLFIFLAAFQKRYPEIRLEVYSGKPTQEQLLLTDLDAFVLPEKPFRVCFWGGAMLCMCLCGGITSWRSARACRWKTCGRSPLCSAPTTARWTGSMTIAEITASSRRSRSYVKI